MVVERGQIWWADLDAPEGSEPGFRRPVLVMQADAFNRSRIQTVIAVALTSNLRLVDVGLTRFRGHLPKGGYDVRNGSRDTKPAHSAEVHG